MEDNRQSHQEPLAGAGQSQSPFAMDRRRFLKTLGGGIVIVFSPLSWLTAAEREVRGPRTVRQLPENFNAFLRIGEDGRVTCFTGKIEMGQGVITSLAQMLADELNVRLESVDMVMGDTDLCPWDMGTFGSRTTRYFGPVLRQAAAEARAVLIELAAEQWRVSPDLLKAEDGSITQPDNPQNRISYADLTRGREISRELKGEPSLEDPSEFTVSGKPADRTDALEKITGKALYAGDIRLPGMLYAAILRPPVHGAHLKRVDVSAVERRAGFQVVKDGDLLAVLHARPDEARKAVDLIKAEFDLPENKLDYGSIYKHLLDLAPQGQAVSQKGNPDEGRRLSSVNFEAAYFTPYVAHAPIEPHTATAHMENGRITVWASTQRPFGAKEEVARDLGLSPDKVRIITPYVGGGFGGKSRNGQAVEAARLAKLTGKPVQVAWSREEEFFYDSFQPAAVVEISSGLDKSNRMIFWDYNVYFAGDRSAETFYDVPHHRTVSHGGWYGAPEAHPFGTGAWRGPGSNTNTFARESHLDLMAAQSGTDPLKFRLAHLKDKRMRRVLEKAATSFGWSPAKTGSGRGEGVACNNYLGTCVAAMAEVEVEKDKGEIQVKRVTLAQDMGRVINPEGAGMQVEGCIMMGLGYALTERVNFRGGDVLDRNFDSYEIPRFSWLPKVETILIDNPGLDPSGGGEPAITCMGAVIANAVFNATGARVFELPLTPDRIRKAQSEFRAKMPRR